MTGNRFILLAFRIVVGGVFLWSGLLKVSDPLGFAQSIANYRLFSREMSFFIALILPWVEVICGVFLLLGIFRASSSLLISGLMAAFLGLVILTLIRGLDIDCGCFGTISRKVDVQLLLADSLLLFFSLSLFFSRRLTLPLELDNLSRKRSEKEILSTS